MTDLGEGTGYGINNAGQVTGSNGHAFLYSQGQMTDLGTLPGYLDSTGYGLNDVGQVVGGAESLHAHLTSPHVFLYSNGQMMDLGAGTASGINNTGQVTGNSAFSIGEPHAFLYSNGQMTDLGTLPGYSFSVPIGDGGNPSPSGEAK
jgi:probable HAF family extracellular repeat protein